MKTRSREQWAKELDEEFSYWKAWLIRAAAGSDADETEDLKWRLDPSADMKQRDYLLPYLKMCAPGTAVNVLDVGSGPLTFFPKRWITRTLRITAVDPLAERY